MIEMVVIKKTYSGMISYFCKGKVHDCFSIRKDATEFKNARMAEYTMRKLKRNFPGVYDTIEIVEV